MFLLPLQEFSVASCLYNKRNNTRWLEDMTCNVGGTMAKTILSHRSLHSLLGGFRDVKLIPIFELYV